MKTIVPSNICIDSNRGLRLSWSLSVKLITNVSLPLRIIAEDMVRDGSAIPLFTLQQSVKTINPGQAKLLPITNHNGRLCHSFVAKLSMAPAIAFSIVVRRDSSQCYHDSGVTLPMQLADANIKRQLVGICVLYRPADLTTAITVSEGEETWQLNVDKVWSEAKSSLSSCNLYIVTASTRITILDSHESRSLQENVMLPGSISNASKLLLHTISTMQSFPGIEVPRIFLLAGPPGVGKTYAMKIAISNSGASPHAEFVRGADILSREEGDHLAVGKCLEKCFSAVKRRSADRVCIVFMDECDALMKSKAAFAALTFQLDKIALERRKVVVVAATNMLECIPQTLRRSGRFEEVLILRPPSFSERQSILTHLVPNDPSVVKELAEETIGFVPADLHALVRKAKMRGRMGKGILSENLRTALLETGPSVLRGLSPYEPLKGSWETIAGDAGGAKSSLVQSIEWPRTMRLAFLRLGLSPPRGVLLYGPPGCAKTTLGRAAAGSESMTFLSLSPADVFSSYVGDAEAVIRKAFATARAASPCILFFDEIDGILGSSIEVEGHGMHRSNAGSAENRVLSTFLNESDGLTSSGSDSVLVIGATNRPTTLDAALLRPGRFDKVIYVPPPDFEGRLAILQKFIESNLMEKNLSDIDLQRLAAISENMTGAEIIGACREAAISELRKSIDMKAMSTGVNQEILEAHLAAVTPLLSDETMLEDYINFEKRRHIRRTS